MFNINDLKCRQKKLYGILKNEYSNSLFFDYSMYYRLFFDCFNKTGLFNDRIKCNKKFYSIVNDFDFYYNAEYNKFLEKIYFNVDNSFKLFKLDDVELRKINLSLNEMIDLSKSFYKSLDEELYLKSLKTLDNTDLIQLCDRFYGDKELCSGLSFFDFTNDITYIAVRKTGTLKDVQALNHEVMHAIDFYTKPKCFDIHSYCFIEIVTYTIDYLFLDYLEKNNYYVDEINKLKNIKMKYIYSLLKIIDDSKSYYSSSNLELEKMFLKKEMELKSTIISYLMYEKFSNDNFLVDLKKIMNTVILRGKRPDFNFVDINDDMILEKSKVYVKEYVDRNNLAK